MAVLKIIAHKLMPVIFLAFSATFLTAQTPASREYQIKAVFLFNFTQFIEWPASSFTNAEAPFVIGILGDNPFGPYLHEVVAGEKANGRPIVIQRYSSVTQIQSCHILFINQAEIGKLAQAKTILKDQSVLIVSDAPDFLKTGGIIRIYTRNNKTQLQINLVSAKAANLVISSKLLRIAEIFEANKK